MFTGATLSAEGLNEIAASLELIRSVAEYIGSIPFIAGSMNMGNTLRELQAIGQAVTWVGNLLASIGEIGFNAMKAIETQLPPTLGQPSSAGLKKPLTRPGDSLAWAAAAQQRAPMLAASRAAA